MKSQPRSKDRTTLLAVLVSGITIASRIAGLPLHWSQMLFLTSGVLVMTLYQHRMRLRQPWFWVGFSALMAGLTAANWRLVQAFDTPAWVWMALLLAAEAFSMCAAMLMIASAFEPDLG